MSLRNRGIPPFRGIPGGRRVRGRWSLRVPGAARPLVDAGHLWQHENGGRSKQRRESLFVVLGELVLVLVVELLLDNHLAVDVHGAEVAVDVEERPARFALDRAVVDARVAKCSAINFGRSPCAISRLANECRRSWKRISGSCARLCAGLNTRRTLTDNRFFGVVIQDGDGETRQNTIAGSQFGIGVVAGSGRHRRRTRADHISGTTVAPVREIACCGFTATAIVTGG